MARAAVGLLTVAFFLGGCGKPENAETGVVVDTLAAPIQQNQTVAQADTPAVTEQPSQAPSRVDSAALRRLQKARQSQAAKQVEADKAKTKAQVPAEPKQQATQTTSPPSSSPAAAAVTPPAAQSKQTSERTRVNTFLSYDAAKKTAYLDIIGGFNGTNGALNFNGGANGSQSIIIPLGWLVSTSFVNKDGDLPHSAIVINNLPMPLPLTSPGPAFPRAFTVKLEEGLQASGTDDMSFTASKEGKFIIFCGVPGHGQGGMWIYLTVSGSASAPAYEP